MLDIIPRLAKLGYRDIDLNFCEMMNPCHDIDEAYIRKLGQLKEDLGLTYVQSHVPYSRKGEDRSEDIKTAIRYSTQLGVKAIVIHPITGDNVSYLSQFLPLLEGTDSCLAVENMESEEEISTSGELLKIIETIGRNKLGICLDTGHAHLRGLDVASEVEKCGRHLIATHIADNDGKSDAHLLPFFGTIEWERVMKAFTKIGYRGAYTYECMYFTRHLPDELKDEAVRLSLKIGDKLLSLR